jgi:hypothetical protein
MTQALTREQMQAAHIRPYGDPSASDIQSDLESSPIGLKLMDLLQLALEIDQKAAKREASHVMNGRRYLFRATTEERVAERLLDLLGSHEDCWFLREIAQDAAERVLEAAE